ncbi:hypothetical protein PWT90_09871 [Aphanocladium album]|nr:hypothetical protein PWT90_09871 [Aphanocladium album]
MRFAAPVALFAALAAAQDSTTTLKVTSTSKQVVTVTQCHSTYTNCPLSSSSSSSSSAVANSTTAIQPTGVVPTGTTGPTVVPTGAAGRLQSGAMAVAAAAVVALAF